MRARILIVDDNDDFLQGWRSLLEGRFDVDAASSGAEGLELLLGGRAYAVVVSDMHMPGMNGVDFLAQCELHSPLTTRVLLTRIPPAGSLSRLPRLPSATVFGSCPRARPPPNCWPQSSWLSGTMSGRKWNTSCWKPRCDPASTCCSSCFRRRPRPRST